MIALITSVAVLTLAIRQNAILTQQNLELRRALRIAKKARSVDYYMDPDTAKEDLWTAKSS
jgi:hypothetical protein